MSNNNSSELSRIFLHGLIQAKCRPNINQTTVRVFLCAFESAEVVNNK